MGSPSALSLLYLCLFFVCSAVFHGVRWDYSGCNVSLSVRTRDEPAAKDYVVL